MERRKSHDEGPGNRCPLPGLSGCLNQNTTRNVASTKNTYISDAGTRTAIETGSGGTFTDSTASGTGSGARDLINHLCDSNFRACG